MTELNHYSVDKQVIFIANDLLDIIRYCEEQHIPYTIFDGIDDILSYEKEYRRDVNILHMSSHTSNIGTNTTNYCVSLFHTETPWD